MKVKLFLAVVLASICWLQQVDDVMAGDLGYGIGLRAGVARLEGDISDPRISPMAMGSLQVLPVPFFGIRGDLGFQRLSLNGHPVHTGLITTLVPFELSAVVNFLPFARVNPFIEIGGGGAYWKSTNNGNDIFVGVDKQDGFDSFLKTGGGIEFRVTPQLGLSLGATYRYSLTDAFDQLWQGDENDQVIDVYGGLTYYFGGGKADRDKDFIADDRDLMPEIAEDRDGYMDHDGIPEKNPNPVAANSGDTLFDNGRQSPGPVVIHDLVNRVEAGNNVRIRANVYSDVELRVVATIYRPIGTRNWNVIRMERVGDVGNNLFEAQIPGYAVTGQGVEYCVVAVDETAKGVGYSGLPSRPIHVEVSPNGKIWRIVGGMVGAAAIGTASYLVVRKQD